MTSLAALVPGWRLPFLLALALALAPGATAPAPRPEGPGDGCRPPTGGLAPPRCGLAPAPRAPAPRGTWIWPTAEPQAEEQAFFQHVFRLRARPVRATLLACCDDVFELRANGAPVAASDSWFRPVRTEIAAHLVAGVNELRVAARNGWGPAALLVELAIELEDGGRVHVLSDEGWICTDERPPGWDGPALGRGPWWRPHGFGARGVAPWGGLEEPVGFPAFAPGPAAWSPVFQDGGPSIPTLFPELLIPELQGATVLPPLRVTPVPTIDPGWLRRRLEQELEARGKAEGLPPGEAAPPERSGSGRLRAAGELHQGC